MLAAIRRNMVWGAIPTAALAAGTTMLLLNIILNPILDGIDPLFTLRYFASLSLGQDVLIAPTTSALLTGLLVHYLLSFVFTFIIGLVVHRWGMMVGLVGGGILGLSFYAINFYTMTLFFPWMYAIAGSLSLIISHLAFGVVAGGVYEYLDDFDLPLSGTENAEQEVLA